MKMKNEQELSKLGPYGDYRDEIIDWWNEWNGTKWFSGKKQLLIIGDTKFIENIFVENISIEQEKILRTNVTAQNQHASKTNSMYTLTDPYVRDHHNLIIISS